VKKLIFLLLFAFAFAGFVSADAAYPPWDANLEAALSGDGAEICAVIPDTVPAVVPLSAERQAGIDGYNKYTERYHEIAITAAYLLQNTA